eukprot:362600-Rhodomonas_salina.1
MDSYSHLRPQSARYYRGGLEKRKRHLLLGPAQELLHVRAALGALVVADSGGPPLLVPGRS